MDLFIAGTLGIQALKNRTGYEHEDLELVRSRGYRDFFVNAEGNKANVFLIGKKTKKFLVEKNEDGEITKIKQETIIPIYSSPPHVGEPKAMTINFLTKSGVTVSFEAFWDFKNRCWIATIDDYYLKINALPSKGDGRFRIFPTDWTTEKDFS